MNVFTIIIGLITEFVFICISLNMPKDKQKKHTEGQTYIFDSMGGGGRSSGN